MTWAVHTGTGNRRYPYWVSDGQRAAALAPNNVQVRKFASAEVAQRVADRLNRRDYANAEVKSAVRYLKAAVMLLTRATKDSTPDDPRIAIAVTIADARAALIGGVS